MQRMCKHCQIYFDVSDKPKGWMANHSRWCEHNPKRVDYVNGSKTSIAAMNTAKKLNPNNINQFTKAKSQGVDLHHSDETRLKISNSIKGFRHSTETKLKLSKIRTAWLISNPDKHPWKSSLKFKSVPCEYLKNYLRSKHIKFHEEYQPILTRSFSADIAFIEHRVIFEVNGNQHYSDVTNQVLSEYYQNRHDIIVSEGWDVIEIPYNKVFDSEYIDELIKVKLPLAPASAF